MIDARLMVEVWEQIAWWQDNDVQPQDVALALGIGDEGWTRLSGILARKLTHLRAKPRDALTWPQLATIIEAELTRPARVLEAA